MSKGDRLKRGFEVYYFDGLGNRQGPIDFEEMMTLMGVLDAESAGSDTELYEDQLSFELHSPETEGAVSDRVVEEHTGSGTSSEAAEGVRE